VAAFYIRADVLASLLNAVLRKEAEAIAEDGPVEEAVDQAISYERKKLGRKPIPKDLPIERI
jgi:hypothetical protein